MMYQLVTGGLHLHHKYESTYGAGGERELVGEMLMRSDGPQIMAQCWMTAHRLCINGRLGCPTTVGMSGVHR